MRHIAGWPLLQERLRPMIGPARPLLALLLLLLLLLQTSHNISRGHAHLFSLKTKKQKNTSACRLFRLLGLGIVSCAGKNGNSKGKKVTGASRESNPGPPAPRAEIIPLDHTPSFLSLNRDI